MASYCCYIHILELPTPHMEVIDAPSLHEAITGACRLLQMFQSADRAELFDGGRNVASISQRDARKRIGACEVRD